MQITRNLSIPFFHPHAKDYAFGKRKVPARNRQSRKEATLLELRNKIFKFHLQRVKDYAFGRQKVLARDPLSPSNQDLAQKLLIYKFSLEHNIL